MTSKVLSMLSNNKQIIIENDKIQKIPRKNKESVLLKLVHHISEHHRDGNLVEESQVQYIQSYFLFKQYFIG